MEGKLAEAEQMEVVRDSENGAGDGDYGRGPGEDRMFPVDVVDETAELFVAYDALASIAHGP